MIMPMLERWRYYCRDLESPDQYIIWSYYWTISAALQRRVWMGDEDFPIYANIFVAFVADPGIGKSLSARIGGNQILKKIVRPDSKQLDPTGKPIMKCDIAFAADCSSPEALIQQLGQATFSFIGTRVKPDGTQIKVPKLHNSLAVLLSEEMTSLFREHTEDIVTFLNQWWDANNFEYRTKHAGCDMIKNVCVALLGCTTPDNIKKLMMRGTLDQGFTARTIFIYENESRQRKLLYEFNDEQKKAFDIVEEHVRKIAKLEGPVTFSPDAWEYFKNLYESGKLQDDICNKDPRLKHYAGRIKVHLIKLSMLVHFGETADSMEVQLDSVKFALQLLRRAELMMHKALATNAKNPLYDSAMDMLEFLSAQPAPIPRRILRQRFGVNLREVEFNECVDFLKLIQQITESAAGVEAKIKKQKIVI